MAADGARVCRAHQVPPDKGGSRRLPTRARVSAAERFGGCCAGRRAGSRFRGEVYPGKPVSDWWVGEMPAMRGGIMSVAVYVPSHPLPTNFACVARVVEVLSSVGTTQTPKSAITGRSG
jgi:hypothetical protein